MCYRHGERGSNTSGVWSSTLVLFGIHWDFASLSVLRCELTQGTGHPPPAYPRPPQAQFSSLSLFLFLPLLFSFSFWPHHSPRRILVLCPGTEPRPQQWKTSSPNHWTTGEFPPSLCVSCLFGAIRSSAGLSLALHLLLSHSSVPQTRLRPGVSRNLRVAQTHSLGTMCILGSKCKIPVTLGLTSLSGFFLCHPLQIPDCVKSEPAEPQSSSGGLSRRCLRPLFLVFLSSLDELILDEISWVRGQKWWKTGSNSCSISSTKISWSFSRVPGTFLGKSSGQNRPKLCLSLQRDRIIIIVISHTECHAFLANESLSHRTFGENGSLLW